MISLFGPLLGLPLDIFPTLGGHSDETSIAFYVFDKDPLCELLKTIPRRVVSPHEIWYDQIPYGLLHTSVSLSLPGQSVSVYSSKTYLGDLRRCSVVNPHTSL